ncbi:PD-(D/E)XK nuclease family protein [Corynebacterium phoceense]|uniref:PD-(D/E)XK nuclease family protein n=1 Tax=Corynebacterium phoceense TaxID=1686286 RepID=A0A540R610_9CORY|nr:PD-(D/E)XK nuclease family protein [Corynebacterium phoceense]TQE43170.1 PD-(D/E)XK nuclease family protein [Corynebacterium phoceense]
MKITFGFGLDGAAWTPSSGLGELTVGPAGLARVLATRLGVTIPVLDKPARIIAYRDRLAELLKHDQAWLRPSFEVDAWAVANQLLTWRDELVTAGIDPRDLADGISQRVDALKAAERPMPIAGEADLIPAVARALGKNPGLKLGIERIVLRDKLDALPPVWKSILRSLGDIVVEEPEQSETLASKVFVTAQNDFEAADVIVSELRKERAAGVVPQLLVTADTPFLDAELLRAGFAPVGKSSNRGGAQALSAFVTAATTAGAVPEIIDLLLMRIDGHALFNADASKALLKALGRDYGYSVDHWNKALAELEGEARAVAKGIDRYLALRTPVDEINIDTLREALMWFAQNAHGEALSTAAKQLEKMLSHYSAISKRELEHLVDAVSRRVGSWSIRPAASHDFEVIGDPAHIRSGATVLWWGALADNASGIDTWSQKEHEGFDGRVLSLKDITRLRTSGQLKALRSARSLVAVVQKQVVGEKGTRPHQLLAQLVAKEVAAGKSFDERFKSASPLLEGALAPVEKQLWPSQPDLTQVNFVPGTQLLPTHMSYSQLATLLARPLEWILAKPLGISEGRRRGPSTGNAMVGTMFHRALELLQTIDHNTWTEDSVSAALERAIGEVAVELNAPGQASRRQELHALGVLSILSFRDKLVEKGWKFDAAEAKFSIPLDVTVEGVPGGKWTIESFNGSRDIDVSDSKTGRRSVLDAKYTTSKNKFEDVVKKNEALQLAIYAWSVGFANVDFTGYWEFRKHIVIDGKDKETTEALYNRALLLLSKRLTDIAAGSVVDEAHQRLRDPETKLDKLTAEVRAELGEEFFFPDEVTYRDYDVLTGLKGNY